jgi:hypothetical protein
MQAAVQSGSIVLLARLVDARGVALRPEEVAAIDYSILRADDSGRGAQQTVVAGQDAASLAVDDVLFDSLECGEPWKVDGVGYNFRHEVQLGAGVIVPEAGRPIVIQYFVTLVRGSTTRIQFRLGEM